MKTVLSLLLLINLFSLRIHNMRFNISLFLLGPWLSWSSEKLISIQISTSVHIFIIWKFQMTFSSCNRHSISNQFHLLTWMMTVNIQTNFRYSILSFLIDINLDYWIMKWSKSNRSHGRNTVSVDSLEMNFNSEFKTFHYGESSAGEDTAIGVNVP